MARILKFNEDKSKLQIAQLESEMEEVRLKLSDVRAVAIQWYQDLLDQYGPHFPRKTSIQSFEVIEAAKVVMKNEKLYVNREEGFIGTSLKGKTSSMSHGGSVTTCERYTMWSIVMGKTEPRTSSALM